ncbi:MAG: ATP-binding cassette domain-containing protein [Anaerolineae bacterium]
MSVKKDSLQRKPTKKRSATQINLYLNLAVFIAFLAAMDPEITGLSIHEWFSLAFSAALILHLLLHWKWVVAITKTFFKKLFHSSRLDYVLNMTLLIWFSIATVSGVMESRHLLPILGMTASQNPFWENLHSASSESLWFPVVVHLLLHWKWILKAIKRSKSMANNDRSTNHVVLSAQGLGKTYGDLEALTDLSFEMRAGEILGLLGPNGAGKTTAIRILTTILPATHGRFSVMDIPDSRPEAIRTLIGVLPESNGFPLHMSGAEFLTYMGRLYGRAKTEAADKAADLLRLFGLEEAARQRIATYSRGMKQRLAIARSLVNDPKVLFLDEPTLGFDPKGQREMLHVIQEVAAVGGTAVLLSSHLLEVVETICHRVLILNHGRVVAEGSVDEIKKQVAVPHTCRIQTAVTAVPDALTALSALDGVTAERHASRADELIVTIPGTPQNGAVNGVLQQLIQAGIPIENFSKDSMRLSDAFLSMID